MVLIEGSDKIIMSRYKKSKDLIVESSNGSKVPLSKLNDENSKVYMKFNLTTLNGILGLVCNCHRPYISYKVINTVYKLFKRYCKQIRYVDGINILKARRKM